MAAVVVAVLIQFPKMILILNDVEQRCFPILYAAATKLTFFSGKKQQHHFIKMEVRDPATIYMVVDGAESEMNAINLGGCQSC